MASSGLLITLYLGMQILGISEDLPLAWINTFKEYPYLFKATFEESKQYFEYFASHEQGAVFKATVKNNFAGFLTGVPLITIDDHCKGIIELFKNENLNPKNFYYLRDVIILPAYRNQGIMKILIAKFQEYAQSLGYKGICLVTSEREENHPLKPSNYRDIDEVWKHLGFTKTSIKMNYVWQTIIDEKGNSELRENTVVFES